MNVEGAPSARAGFEALLEHQLDALFGYAVRMTRNRQEAEDVLQEAVLRALTAWRSFQPGTNFKAWLFTVVTNAYISKYRRRMRDPVRAVEILPEDGAEDAALDAVYAPLLTDEVELALRDLPEAFRGAVLLVDLEGLSYRDTAASLGVPVGTVMSRLSRGRAMLRNRLTRAGGIRRRAPDGGAS